MMGPVVIASAMFIPGVLFSDVLYALAGSADKVALGALSLNPLSRWWREPCPFCDGSLQGEREKYKMDCRRKLLPGEKSLSLRRAPVANGTEGFRVRAGQDSKSP